MSNKAINAVRDARIGQPGGRNSGRKLILLLLADRMNKDTGKLNVSLQRLAYDAGMSRDQVDEHVKWLKGQGLISVKPGTNRGGASTPHYVLNWDLLRSLRRADVRDAAPRIDDEDDEEISGGLGTPGVGTPRADTDKGGSRRGAGGVPTPTTGGADTPRTQLNPTETEREPAHALAHSSLPAPKSKSPSYFTMEAE